MHSGLGSPELPENRPLREFVDKSARSPTTIEDASRPFGRRSITWRILTRDGETYYLKRHEHRQHYQSEVIALTTWTPRMAESCWWSVPRLVAKSDQLGALLVTGLEGVLVDEAACSSQQMLRIYEMAGRFAALIHGADFDCSGSGRPRFYDSTTVLKLIDTAKPYLAEDSVLWIERTFRKEGLWKGLQPVPVHADYSPRNWIVTESSSTIGIIDWERSRSGYWIEDVQFMVYRYWDCYPQYADAFYSGYGRVPTADERLQMNLVVLANAVGGVSWAITHDDTEFARVNRYLIDRCRRAIMATT